MKRVNILVGFYLLMGITSCNLDRYPYDGIEMSTSLNTVKDATSFNRGLYSTLRDRLYKRLFYTDIQADFLNATYDYGNNYGDLHRWTFRSNTYELSYVWKDNYSAIRDINFYIEKAAAIVTEVEEEKVLLKQYNGVAHLLRAFYYHRLIQRFGKDYEPSTASSDLGVPIVLKYDIFLKPARNSVGEVYAQILKDIAVAKNDLADVKGNPMTQTLNIDCVKALEARVLLDMHDWKGAKAVADELIASNTYPLISNAAAFKDMWVRDTGSEIIMQAFASQPSELGSSIDVYLRYSTQPKRFIPWLIPQQWIVDLYESSDIRRDAYLEQKNIRIQGKDFNGLYLINKYPGNPELYTSVSNYQHKPIMFRIAEMYLISAEAAAQLSGSEADALATLNSLRVSRGLNPLVNLSGSSLMDKIKEERLRELLCEGTRIDDLKRWKMGFSRKPAQNNETIIRGEFYDAKVVQPDNPLFVWGIPSREIILNPKLVQNPGW